MFLSRICHMILRLGFKSSIISTRVNKLGKCSEKATFVLVWGVSPSSSLSLLLSRETDVLKPIAFSSLCWNFGAGMDDLLWIVWQSRVHFVRNFFWYRLSDAIKQMIRVSPTHLENSREKKISWGSAQTNYKPSSPETCSWLSWGLQPPTWETLGLEGNNLSVWHPINAVPSASITVYPFHCTGALQSHSQMLLSSYPASIPHSCLEACWPTESHCF